LPVKRSTTKNRINQKLLDEESLTYVEKINGDLYQRHLCMHCIEPTCASVCPVSALKKTKEGAVIYNSTICLGCRYCIMACPFHIPKYEWHSPFPKVKKCDLCYETRSSKGEETACASVCPTGATIFGNRDELFKIAKSKIEKIPINIRNCFTEKKRREEHPY